MPQLYTYDQLKNATAEQLKADPNLLRAWSQNNPNGIRLVDDIIRNYGAGGLSSYWQSQLAPDAGNNRSLERQVDRYLNWNNPLKPDDQKAAFVERDAALAELEQKKKQYEAMGIDIMTVPTYSDFYKQLNYNPAGGTSAGQAILNQQGQGFMDKPQQVAGGQVLGQSTGGKPNYEEFQINGTYYAYDQATGQGIAFPSMETFQQFFGRGPNPQAPTLPVDPQIFNSAAGQLVQGQVAQGGATGGAGGGVGNGAGGGILGQSGFSTGVPELDALYGELSTYLEKLIESGQTINPNIELTPAEVQKFVDQASAEVSPYYQSQIASIKGELSNNLTYLKQQYDLKKKADEAQFQQSLGNKREELAGAGLAFSGGRAQQEQGMQTAETLSQESQALSASKAAGDAVRAAEKAVGSSNLGGLDLSPFSAPIASLAGKGGYTAGRTLDFGGQGNITGSLEYAQRGDTRNLADFLKAQEINKRTLAFGG